MAPKKKAASEKKEGSYSFEFVESGPDFGTYGIENKTGIRKFVVNVVPKLVEFVRPLGRGPSGIFSHWLLKPNDPPEKWHTVTLTLRQLKDKIFESTFA
jgi:hypothetical protein